MKTDYLVVRIVACGLACFLAASTLRAAPPTRPADAGPPATTRPADEGDFARRLLEGDSSEAEAGTKLLAAMAESQRRLLEQYDPGSGTQSWQARALAALDEIIELARKAEGRPSRGGQSATGERRQHGRAGARGSAGAADPSDAAARRPDGAPTTQPAADRRGIGTDAADRQRSWGFLPQRDREELLQGQDEEFSAKYREHIERYYRALAEEGRKE